MGIFDTLFGGVESYDNPLRKIGKKMPGAMRSYFEDIQSQMQSALSQAEASKQRQFDLFEQMYGARAGGLEEMKQMIQDRPSFVGDFERVGRKRLGQEMQNIERRSDARAISRGLGMSSVPLAQSAAGQSAITANFESGLAQMKAGEAAQKRGDLENIMRMQSMLGSEQLGKRAQLEAQYAPYTFDPSSFMGFEMERIGMQPFGMMQQPVEYYKSGFAGNLLGNTLGQIGGGAISGLMG